MAFSRAARQSLRNLCRAHEDAVVRRFGRAATLEETAFGAFLALRLRAKHDLAVQVERTEPFNEFEAVDEEVRTAARAYENREQPATPYERFAAGRDLPSPAAMKGRDL